MNITTEPNHTLDANSHSAYVKFAKKIDQSLGKIIAYTAALLIMIEVGVLFVGVVSRYFFHAPIFWVDEVASILFLWLASLGSVVALNKSEHMRMTAVLSKLSVKTIEIVDPLSRLAIFIFLLSILHPAYEYAYEESYVITPGLGISNAWRAGALPFGIALMSLISLIKIIELPRLRQAGIATAIVAAITVTLYILLPTFSKLGNINLIIFFVGVTGVMVFLGIPIAVSFGMATLGYLGLTTHMPIMVMVGRMDEGMSHLILLAVPLFVFLGLLIEMTGMAKAMVAFLASLLGHVRGGLSYVLIGAMYLVSGISGSKVADMAAVAPVLFPEMQKRGAKSGDLIALLSATGAQTETIPPSLVLITIGSVTGVSIAALFNGGLLPGLVLGATLCFVVWSRYRNEDLSQVKKATSSEITKAFFIALPAIALPFVIRAAVVEGIATATEVSTLGIAYSILAGVIFYRQFPLKRVIPMLIETASLTGAILFIIGTATAMAWALTQSGFSSQLANLMMHLSGGATMFLVITIIAFIILGSVLEGIPAIVLFGPLVFPIAKMMGIHEVHYAMVVVLSMGIGLFAPPFGVGYYAACAISKINPTEGMKPIIGYLCALIIGLAIVAAFPIISIGFL
jgi:tripartite ATP-independent transporter DctM subunit